MPDAMEGKVVLVTGGTSGIGLATASGLARLGASLAIIGRDQGRTDAAVAQIRREAGPTAATVEGHVADLSAQAEVRRVARVICDRFPRLDVLVNNAGAVFAKSERTVDGYERTWATNHLAYFLLTLELLDLLRASAPARVVNVASGVHKSGTIDFDALDRRKPPVGIDGYRQSKLANVMFTYALARRLDGTGVTANALHPGIVATRFGRGSGLMGMLLYLVRPMMKSPEKGALTSIFLASSPSVEGVSGKYFADCAEQPSSELSRDRSLQDRLWDMSVRQTEKRPS